MPEGTSPGAKTPMVNVLMLGLPLSPMAARFAMLGMSSGLHSSGMPSVARTATTECAGFAIGERLRLVDRALEGRRGGRVAARLARGERCGERARRAGQERDGHGGRRVVRGGAAVALDARRRGECLARAERKVVHVHAARLPRRRADGVVVVLALADRVAGDVAHDPQAGGGSRAVGRRVARVDGRARNDADTLKKHGPAEPHCELAVHVVGTPACVSGKYWRPTPIPADAGSLRNAVMAETTEFHFDFWAATRSSIEPDVSSMR